MTELEYVSRLEGSCLHLEAKVQWLCRELERQTDGGYYCRDALVTAQEWDAACELALKREKTEQAAKPQRWGSKERVALVAEVLRQRRIAKRLSEMLANLADKDCGETTPEYWLREAEKAVADEISPKG